VLLGVTGGIAAYKAAELARELQRAGAEVQPLLTESGERMISRATFAALTGRPVPASVWDDPAAVTHVDLARWGQERCLGGPRVTLSVCYVSLSLLPLFQRRGFLKIQLMLPRFVAARQAQSVLDFGECSSRVAD